MQPADFDEYTTKHPIDIFVFGIGVRRTLSKTESAIYASRLMSRAALLMAEKGEQGVEIHGLYTTSYTPYGINICERMGFRTLEGSTTKLRSFELIVAKNNSFLVRPYRKAFDKWQDEQKTKNSKNKRGTPR